MKNLGKKLLFVVLLLLVAIYVDIPARFPIHINIGPLKVNQSYDKAILKKNLLLGLDLVGGSRVTFEADTSKVSAGNKEQALESLKSVMERRVNLFGVSEANVSRSSFNGKDRIIIELPGVSDTKQAISVVGKTAQLVFGQTKDETSLEPTNLTGADLKNASVSFDQVSGKPVVSLEFTNEGAKKFEEITGKNIGKILAIVLDDQIVSTPVVNEKIIGGKAQISGNFTQEQALGLAVQLNAGALPLPVSIVNEQTVGASLGNDAIQKSIKAGVVGLLLVLLFMIVIYRRLGLIAAFGILVFAILTLALYKLVPVVLTLPGITGFLLSVGMAVDANILIFERYKEEKAKGANSRIAMEAAFGRAWNSIRDANVATLITAFVLANPLEWQFLNVSGPVRGFAFTLALGIAVGLFTGTYLTRNIMRFFIRK